AWEKACETFLHEELEYVVVRGWDEAERGVELIRAESDGRATFLVHGVPPAHARGSDEPNAGRLSDVLRFTNGFAASSEGLLSRLAQCYLATDREAAQALAAAHPQAYFLLADGSCYHGPTVSGGRKTAGGPLALKRELRELTSQVETRERESETVTSEIE